MVNMTQATKSFKKLHPKFDRSLLENNLGSARLDVGDQGSVSVREEEDLQSPEGKSVKTITQC